LWKAIDRERPQLFVADDAFGSTEHRPDAAEHWARELGPMVQAVDKRHWLTEVSGRHAMARRTALASVEKQNC
jgi:hypothetical protein